MHIQITHIKLHVWSTSTKNLIRMRISRWKISSFSQTSEGLKGNLDSGRPVLLENGDDACIFKLLCSSYLKRKRCQFGRQLRVKTTYQLRKAASGVEFRGTVYQWLDDPIAQLPTQNLQQQKRLIWNFNSREFEPCWCLRLQVDWYRPLWTRYS